jgi:hypothetical protein
MKPTATQFQFDLTAKKPTQAHWDEVLQKYDKLCDGTDQCISDLPKNVDTFLSAKVPWKYQNVNMNAVSKRNNNNANNKNNLRMIRVWATMGRDIGKLFDYYYETDGTVAGAYEITGLYYSDGNVLLWDPSKPPEKALLGKKWRNVSDEKESIRKNESPIDDAHLDVMLFRMPRTLVMEQGYLKDNDNDYDPKRIVRLTVQGTVRHVLQQIRDSGYSPSGYYTSHGYSDFDGFTGLVRPLSDVLERSTEYTVSSSEIGVTMTPERAKWQTKIKDIVGIEGAMNGLSYNTTFTRGRISAYNDPDKIKRDRPQNRAAYIAARRKKLNAFLKNKYKNYRNVDLGNGVVLKAEKVSANTFFSNDELRSKKNWHDAPIYDTTEFRDFVKRYTTVKNVTKNYLWAPTTDPTKYKCTLKNNFWKKDCPRYLKDTRNKYMENTLKQAKQYLNQGAKFADIPAPKFSKTDLDKRNLRGIFSARELLNRERLIAHYYGRGMKPYPKCKLYYATEGLNLYWNNDCPQAIRKAMEERQRNKDFLAKNPPKNIVVDGKIWKAPVIKDTNNVGWVKGRYDVRGYLPFKRTADPGETLSPLIYSNVKVVADKDCSTGNLYWTKQCPEVLNRMRRNDRLQWEKNKAAR